MAKAAEGMARASGAIAAGGGRGGVLAMAVKAAAKSRRGEVRSMLASFRGARGRASWEQAAEMRKATRARHGEVGSTLAGLKQSRRRASREYLKQVDAATRERKAQVSALLTRFFHERVARRCHRRGLATALRHKAAAFMRDLTGGVATLRDGFAKQGRDRAAAIHGRLLAYALDRREATAVWREGLKRASGALAERGEAGQRPAAAPRAADRPPSQPVPTPPSSPRASYQVAATASANSAARSARAPSGPRGAQGSATHHGKGSK